MVSAGFARKEQVGVFRTGGFLVLLCGRQKNMKKNTLFLGNFFCSNTDEFSQLYRAPWIDAVRATRLGALVLGQGFLWSDLWCYAAGVTLAAGIDWILARGGRR